MDFFKNFWFKKNKAKNTRLTNITEKNVNVDENHAPQEKFTKASQIIQHCQVHDVPEHVKTLQDLKTLLQEPFEAIPDLRFSQIKGHLNEQICYATIREERWEPSVYCPLCHSIHIVRLDTSSQVGPHNYRYKCLDCQHQFNDDSQTPFETGKPPLHIWMQCWYLLGCTSSISYIASKLNLDLASTQEMIAKLQKVFNTKKPLTRFLGYDEWNKQSDHYQKKIKQEILDKQEILIKGDSTHQPADTREYKKQKEKRTNPKFDPKI